MTTNKSKKNSNQQAQAQIDKAPDQQIDTAARERANDAPVIIEPRANNTKQRDDGRRTVINQKKKR